MATQGAGDGYWQFGQSLDDDGPSAGGGEGYLTVGRQPLHRTASDDMRQSLGASLGLGGTPTGGVDAGQRNGVAAFSSFDPLDHARLSPSAFDPNNFSRQFAMPRFASGGPSDPFGFGVGVVDAPLSTQGIGSPMPFDFSSYGSQQQPPTAEQPAPPSPFYPSSFAPPSATMPASSSTHIPQQPQHRPSIASTSSSSSNPFSHSQSTRPSTSGNPIASTSSAVYAPPINPPPPNQAPSIGQPYHVPAGGNLGSSFQAPTSAELESPIYAPYGSSVISVNQTPNAAYKLPQLAMNLPPSQPGVQPFDPAGMGLPVPPPPGGSNNFAGLYSSSGFDMLGVLARVAARPNPQIQIGPVDSSCAFAVVDARRFDQPLCFVSDTFVTMTGYSLEEIIGRNCRFLQSPGGATVQGAPRKYTDGNAAWHMRQHIQAGKESQSSLINYTKSGRPFINLVTIIPICWDTDEIAYYVGFQVDLVDQPNAILNRMRGGSYVVNYSLVGQQYANAIIPNPSLSGEGGADDGRTISMQFIEGANAGGMAGHRTEPDEWTMLEDLPEEAEQKPAVGGPAAAAVASAQMQQQQQQQQQPPQHAAPARLAPSQRPTAAQQMAGVGGEASSKSDEELLDLVTQHGFESLELEVDRRAFHKLILGEADDFVHVLSLKGSVLYCSPSVERVLEYAPGELVGTTLASLCHPSDVVPVMRQLKDASSASNPHVKLLYRVRRKHSGYVWVEAHGKLHIEPGKGRKCVIAVARVRDVASVNWNELRQSGGLGDTEFFSKVSTSGTLLFVTAGVQGVLGLLPQETTGSCLYDLALPEYRQSLEVAIQQAQLGVPATVRYKLRNRNGAAVDVVTKFFPHHGDIPDSSSQTQTAAVHIAIIAQTNELSSEQRKANSLFSQSAPVYSPSPTAGRSPAISDTGSNASSTGGSNAGGSGFHSTFKTLAHPSSTSDNIFDELEVRRPTSWQFELHQLQSVNKKLRDEKEYLQALGRGRGSVSDKPRKTPSDTGSRTSSNVSRVCQNCGRTESPEWRAGPGGPKTLCNSCGLRHAKHLRHSAKRGVNTTAASDVPLPLASPTSSTGSTLAALAPLGLSPPSTAQQSPQNSGYTLPPADVRSGPTNSAGSSGWQPQQP
ncbi:hypothetical protein JCM10213_003208 [Rhodosporidiobolus nylandii]